MATGAIKMDPAYKDILNKAVRAAGSYFVAMMTGECDRRVS